MISHLAGEGVDRAVARVERRRRLTMRFGNLLGAASRQPDHASSQDLGGAFVWLERAGRVATVSSDSQEGLDRALAAAKANFREIAHPGVAPPVSASGSHLLNFAGDARALEHSQGIVTLLGHISANFQGSSILRSLSCLFSVETRHLAFVVGDRNVASYDRAAVDATFILETTTGRHHVRVAGPGVVCLYEATEALERALQERSIASDGIRVPGRAPVVLSGQAAGMFAHECIAHTLEADQFNNGCLTLGETFADALDVVDDGNVTDMSGYCPIDDEGEPARRTHLIERGRIGSLLHSLETAAAMDHAPTGNGRALDWRHAPIPRCSNTVVGAGNVDDNALFDGIGRGVYVVEAFDASGGPTFVIGVRRARWIRGGRLGPHMPLRAITGQTRTTLSTVEAIGQRTEDQFLMVTGCGKQNQGPLAVGTRAPRIRIADACLLA